MFKNLLKANIYYLISSVFGKGLIFFLLPIITRLLTPAEFGIIDYILIIAAFVYLVAGIETRQGVARFLPETTEPDEKINIISTQLLFVVGCYMIFILISVVYYWLFSQQEISFLLYISAVAAITMNGIWQNIHSIFRWDFRYKEYTFLEILYFLLVFGSAIIFIRQFHFSSEGYFLGMLFGAFMTSIIGIYLQRHLFRFEFNQKTLNSLITYSGPLVFAALAAIASSFMDRIFIKKMMTLNDLGIYGVGFRVASVVLILIVAFQSALTPLVFKHYKDPSTPKKLAFLSKVFIYLFIGICFFFYLYSDYLVAFFAPASYSEASQIVPLIVMSIVFFKIYIFAPGLSIAKKTNIILYIQLGALIINGLLNYYLIPLYGIKGAATATLLASFILFCVNLYFSQQYYNIPYDSRRLLGYLFIMSIIVAVLHYLMQKNLMSFALQSLSLVVIMFFSAFLIFKQTELIEIKKKIFTLIKK